VFRGKPASINKINQTLQICELSLLKGFETKHIFEEVSGFVDGIYGGKVEVTFNVKKNTDRALSIQFKEASCGATCRYWVNYYNFNPGNGDLVQLRDLFTRWGYDVFFKQVTKKRIAQFKRELRKVKASEREGYQDIIGSYELDDSLEDFYLKGNAIYIDGENSFSKHQKFAGIETISRFNLNEFENHLNEYGKCFFSLMRCSIAKFRSRTLPQLFHGTIAGQNVLMILNTEYDIGMRAEYLYTKYGKGIFLTGELIGTKLEMTEKDAKYKDSGSILADFDGTRLEGVWTDKDRIIHHRLLLSRR
jgi:hypothetical protein